MGLEPTTLGITIRCSNQLSYSHRISEPKIWAIDGIPVSISNQTAFSAVDHNIVGRNGQFRPRAKNRPKPPAAPPQAASSMDNLKESGFVWEAYKTQKTRSTGIRKRALLTILSVM